MRYVSGTKLDERIIRCDLDLGYKEGRQFGRGKSGGQVRDEHRQDYDPGRGGWGAQAQRMEIDRRKEVEERYADAQDGPGAVAGGGGDWKESEQTQGKLKRGRSPDDEDDSARVVSDLGSWICRVLSVDRASVRVLTMRRLNVCDVIAVILKICAKCDVCSKRNAAPNLCALYLHDETVCFAFVCKAHDPTRV